MKHFIHPSYHKLFHKIRHKYKIKIKKTIFFACLCFKGSPELLLWKKKTSLSLHQTLGCWPNKQKEKNSIEYCRKREASDQRHGALCCFRILLYSVSGAINSVGINCVMTPHSLVSFSPNWTALLLCSQPLSLDFSLFFFVFVSALSTNSNTLSCTK